MKTEKIFWGVLLVFVGGIFLLENFDIIDFRWGYVWRFWPVILILAGVNILFSKTNSKVGLIITLVVTILSLGLLTYKGIEKGNNDNKTGWSFSDNDNDFDSDDSTFTSSSTFSEEYDKNYTKANLEIFGGAGTFDINDSTAMLFNAETNETGVRYLLKKTGTDSVANLEFRMKNQNKMRFNNKDGNTVRMGLNLNPVWDINLKMGAGQVNFDLSSYKINNINLEGGAAEFNIKMGDLLPVSNLSAETGVASVNIEVPLSVGCQVKTSTGLSSRDFEGFIKKEDNTWETENFQKAGKKIFINLKGGLSNFEVNRY